MIDSLVIRYHSLLAAAPAEALEESVGHLDLLNLLVVLLAAWAAGRFVSRFGYPAVLGEIMAGILIGPPLLGLVHAAPALDVLGEVGVLLMMLYIGMEIDPRELGKASWPGVLAAIGGFTVPFALAYLVMHGFGQSHMAGLFVGIAAGVTSLATKSRILVDLKILETRIAHVLMAGALICDTLSLVVFAGILGMAEEGSLALSSLGRVVLEVGVFFLVTGFIGLKIFPYVGRLIERVGPVSHAFLFLPVLLIAVLFGELAEVVGLHAILGSFMAGLFLRENVLGRDISRKIMRAVHDVSIGFLAPIFFVTAGFAVSFGVFGADLGLFLAILFVATAGKIFGTALFYLPTGFGWREGVAIGAGMNGRGAVEIIVAGIALEMGLIGTEVFSILVFMAILTTATVPLFLKWGTDWLRRRGELVPSSSRRTDVVVVGADPLARRVASILRPEEGRITLVDSSDDHCDAAEEEGFSVIHGSAVDEDILADAHTGEARVLACLTPNAEINLLAGQLGQESFLVPEVVISLPSPRRGGHETLLRSMEAPILFGRPANLTDWNHHVAHGRVEQREIPVETTEEARAMEEQLVCDLSLLPCAVRRDEGIEPYHSGTDLEPGDVVIVLETTDGPFARRGGLEELVTRRPSLDIERRVSLEEALDRIADELAGRMDAEPDEIRRALVRRESLGGTLLKPGVLVPHGIVEEPGCFELLLVRFDPGLDYPDAPEPVEAAFCLLASPDRRTDHLKLLSTIVRTVRDDDFLDRWREADDPWDALEPPEQREVGTR